MALDKYLAQKLWDERYREQFEAFAFKNKYLHETGDPEDMFQEMWIKVYAKAVEKFDMSKVTYLKNTNVQSEEALIAATVRAFNAFVTTIMNQYFANLKTKSETGKQQWTQQLKSGDERMKGEEGEGPTLLERVPNLMNPDPDTQADLETLYHNLPEDLAEPLRYIIQNAVPGKMSETMKEIRDKWGWTQTRLFNALLEEPEFVEFVTNI